MSESTAQHDGMPLGFKTPAMTGLTVMAYLKARYDPCPGKPWPYPPPGGTRSAWHNGRYAALATASSMGHEADLTTFLLLSRIIPVPSSRTERGGSRSPRELRGRRANRCRGVMDMARVCTALKDTPVPTVLVVVGIGLLRLSIAGPFAGRMAVAPERQRWAAMMVLDRRWCGPATNRPTKRALDKPFID